jgi:AcrR family transcriptional regulator
MLDYDDRYSKTTPMNDSAADPRQRLVLAAADMLRHRGLNATSVREVAKLAQAPLGSTYHYFPGGKPQLISEAVQLSGEQVARYLTRTFAAGPRDGLLAFVALWRQLLQDKACRAGCPVMAVAADDSAADDDAPMLAAVAAAIRSWQQPLVASLQQAGLPAARATRLATLLIAAVEGAILLCRAQGDTTALDEVAAELLLLLDKALAEAATQDAP